MRIARHLSPITKLPEFGVLIDDFFWCIEGNNPYNNLDLTGDKYPLKNVKLIAPCAPQKIIGIALNFSGIRGHDPNMSEPLIFLKAPNTITGPDSIVEIPFHSLEAWGEAELAVVIKKRASKIRREFVDDYVFGFTIANDVSVSNVEGRDHHLARSKSVDGFCPIGPWIETDLSLNNLDINAFQNGELIRAGNTKDHHWNWREIVFQVSQWMCLEQGDIILTGNPPDINGWVYLDDGAKFEVTISNIGTLTTYFSINESKRRVKK